MIGAAKTTRSNLPFRKRSIFDLIIAFMAMSTIFISGLYVRTPLGLLYYSHIIMAAVYVIMAIRTSSFGLTRDYLIVYVATAIISLLGIFTVSLNYDISLSNIPISLAKLSFFLFFACFYTLFYNFSGRSIVAAFRDYHFVATLFAALGVVQQVVFIITGYNILSPFFSGAKNYGSFLGVSGFSVEPAFYACALLPAGAYHISEFIRRFRLAPSGVIIISAIIMSTSSLGYIGLAISAFCSIFAIRDVRSSLIAVFSAPLAFALLYVLVSTEFFQLRLNDTIDLLSGGNLTLRRGMNMSTYSNAVNSSIAFKSLGDNNGMGPGFGLYSTVFDRYIFGYELPTYRLDIPGRGSGTSMFVRLTAEIGVMAWAYFAVLIILCLRNIRDVRCPTSIGIAYLSTFGIIMLRMGEYYANGVIMVIVMIYLAHKQGRNSGESSANDLIAARKRLFGVSNIR